VRSRRRTGLEKPDRADRREFAFGEMGSRSCRKRGSGKVRKGGSCADGSKRTDTLKRDLAFLERAIVDPVLRA
jgi:hypothetical protein